jgi:hypothetical protein
MYLLIHDILQHTYLILILIYVCNTCQILFLNPIFSRYHYLCFSMYVGMILCFIFLLRYKLFTFSTFTVRQELIPPTLWSCALQHWWVLFSSASHDKCLYITVSPHAPISTEFHKLSHAILLLSFIVQHYISTSLPLLFYCTCIATSFSHFC